MQFTTEASQLLSLIIGSPDQQSSFSCSGHRKKYILALGTQARP